MDLEAVMDEVADRLSDIANLVPNPLFETDVSGWFTTTATIARSTAQAKSGEASMLLTVGTGNPEVVFTASGTSGFSVLADASYTLTAWTRAATIARGTRVVITWYDSAGAQISQSFSGFVDNSTSAWTEHTVTATAPSNAAFGRAEVQIGGGPATGEQHYIDEVVVAGADEPTLRVYAWPADSVSVPAAVVGYPESIVFDATYGRGMDSMTLPVWLVIGKASNRAARTKVAAYCNGSGASSVKAVLEGAEPVAFHTLRVADVEFDAITVGGTEYIAARFTLDITGQGS